MMVNIRGFLVWGVSILVIVGLFLFVVSNGWPGSPNKCTQTTPNTCFCEAYKLVDIQSGAAGVRQSVNTWSNLYSILSSLLIAFVVFLDRVKLSGGRAANLMRSTGYIPDLYIFAVLFLGLGSLWFHASLTVWGDVLDGFAIYLFSAFLVFYSIRRFYPSACFFWIGCLFTAVLFASLHTSVGPLINTLILVFAYILVEVYIWKRTGKILQGRRYTIVLWLLAITTILIASFFWWASQTDNFLCNPDSFFQPHGLIWHPLAGVSAVLMYFYFRAAKDPI